MQSADHLRLVPLEPADTLSLEWQARLVEIAHTTPHSDIRGAALKVLEHAHRRPMMAVADTAS